MRDKNNVVERRRSCRHSLKIPLRILIWGSSGPSREATSLDISEEGALLETDLVLGVGAILDLRIELPEEITGRPSTEWRCKSRVVHTAPGASLAHPVKVGVHFDWLNLSSR